jgi:aspartyl-tRNA(Asn)/glutamyl-tRNA(Gln) amidotransferase subunit B
MAHPGVLPVINKAAIRHVLRVGIAVNGELADYSEFDRKNYFYPDLPKAYQLSQYKFPLVSGGELNGVQLTRIHLEEDTARSLHTSDESTSLVDFNRSGVPLMELVTEPVVHSAKDASRFARELQLLLRTLEVSHANMEKGEMRVEANISVSKNKGELGTKVEVKNLNSFRSVERAIDFEVKRQSALLEEGGRVTQETRGWDENKGVTFSQRLKEEAADYRYFPEPDLPKLKLSEVPEFSRVELVKTLPKLPGQTRAHLQSSYTLGVDDVDVYVFDPKLSEFFETVASEFRGDTNADKKIKLASNYIVNNLLALRDELDHHVAENIDPANFAEVVELAHGGAISSNGAVELIARMAKAPVTGKSIRELAEAEGLLQQNDEHALMAVVESVIASNRGPVDEYKNGKEQSMQFLVGQGMKESKGRANPIKLKELLVKKLG